MLLLFYDIKLILLTSFIHDIDYMKFEFIIYLLNNNYLFKK